MKNNLESMIHKLWSKSYDFQEIETTLVHHKEVFVHSGHWNKFVDPIIRTKSGAVFRLDHLIEENTEHKSYDDLSSDEIIDIQQTKLSKLKQFTNDPLIETDKINYRHLMMKTQSGNNECGLRPETASSTYQAFIDMYNYNKKTFPFGIYQIGKAFRNEINCRRSILRCREFTQAESQYFVMPDEKQYFDLDSPDIEKLICQLENHQKGKELLRVCNNNKIQELTIRDLIMNGKLNNYCFAETILNTLVLFDELSLTNKLRLRQHASSEKAHYAIDAWDIEIELPLAKTYSSVH